MDLNTLREYILIHRISLEQDKNEIDYINAHHFYKIKEAEIELCNHLLEYING
jgi:hypothetical protein